jgi:aryl-alcohol dehydrogenase-like predicted oxidoreductase
MIETPTPTAAQTEEIKVTADSLLATFRQLVHEGNVRRIGLKNEDGHVVAEFPLAAGLVGAVFFPQVAAVAAIAALLAHFTIVVERAEGK